MTETSKSGSVAKVERGAQVQEWLGRLEKTADVVLGLMGELGERFRPVMREEPPSAPTEERQVEDLVYVSLEISRVVDVLERVKEMQEGMLERAEV